MYICMYMIKNRKVVESYFISTHAHSSYLVLLVWGEALTFLNFPKTFKEACRVLQTLVVGKGGVNTDREQIQSQDRSFPPLGAVNEEAEESHCACAAQTCHD